ncbi:TetR/AcrR family transcriptional regulator [Cryptosporangium phraense]|uniref:TetR/AcrR family transcriptional regulator n=1 Tax=Cryptosporangium phraense TaxID=2593070 RepID=A0A545AP27_9ACTN|nr:TetR/AcrR family transcriptional regulator [Cryptosporangium phraense]TQS43067.1 TetR/AcrR family transcriptional regulator [Cryptosporangium phraense]
MPPRRSPVSRRDRPAKPPLSRDGVVAVALRILRAEGLDKVTMRRLAAELDTGPSSLYVYLRNMAEVHGAVLDALLADLPMPSGSDDPKADLVDLLSAYTALLYEHPSLARSVLALWPSGPNYLRLIDTTLGLLVALGVPPRPAAWGVDALLQYATSTAAEQGTRDENDSDWDGLTEAIARASNPFIARHRDELFSGTPDEKLRWTFTALINGIAGTETP